MMRIVLLVVAAAALTGAVDALPVRLGPRPSYLVGDMADSALKTSLQQCLDDPAIHIMPHDFSIGHRGAPMQFPEVRDTSANESAEV